MCVATYLTKTDRDSWKCFLTMCCTIYFGFFSWLHPSVSVSQTSLVVNLMTRLVQTVVWHDFSILGMNLFGCKFRQDDATIIGLQPVGPHRVRHRKNFDNLLWAIITVFQVNDCRYLADFEASLGGPGGLWSLYGNNNFLSLLAIGRFICVLHVFHLVIYEQSNICRFIALAYTT